MKNACHPTDLTEDQWAPIKLLLPRAKRRGRLRTCLRTVVNSLLYVVKSGCQRRLPQTFPAVADGLPPLLALEPWSGAGRDQRPATAG